ncbi:MAG: lytic murein transglycosylase B [Burkholderiales bacterium]|nr:lytic murein transglycosylase B [Burkholderiales bacterium]
MTGWILIPRAQQTSCANSIHSSKKLSKFILNISNTITSALTRCFLLGILLGFTLVHVSGEAQAAVKKVAKSKHAKKHAKKKISSTQVNYLQWHEVQNFITELSTQQQFNRSYLQDIFKNVRQIDTAIQLVKPAPPGKPKNWKAYRARFVENGRIEAGLAFWERNLEALNRAEQEFGVPPEIIVGLIGVETIYGKTTGSFRAIDVLSTLAFSYPDTPNRDQRQQFFRKELTELLLWSREHTLDVFTLKSSYAGALGLSQFMPSSLRSFAIDFDHDGKIDLRESESDAIGSVANYLAKHGWKKGLPDVYPASLISDNTDPELLARALGQGLQAKLSLDQLSNLVSSAEPAIPKQSLYGLIDLQNGDSPDEYWIVTDNFFAITHYNRSYFYAMSVIDLGKVIALARKK